MFNSMQIRLTILASYIFIGLLTLAIGISTLLTYSKIESSSQQTADVLVKLSQEIHIIDYHLEDVGIYLLAEGSPNAVNIMPGESPQKLLTLIADHFSRCEKHFTSFTLPLDAQISETITKGASPSLLDKFDKAETLWNTFSEAYLNFLPIFPQLDTEQRITTINGQLLPHLKDLIVQLHDFQLHIVLTMATEQSLIHRTVKESKAWIIPLTVFSLVLAIFLCWLSCRLILSPLNTLVETMTRIQKGVTTARFKYTSNNEMGYLAITFNAMVMQLHESIETQSKTQVALEKNQRLLSDFFEFAPDSIILIDSNGIIKRVNHSTETLFGWERNELIGRKFRSLIASTFSNLTENNPEEILHQVLLDFRGASGSKIQLTKKDGSNFEGEINFKTMDTEDGPLIAASIRDIGHREPDEIT